jgi:dipeptidyl aminopeptidase/acylaminoacyl peptidase
MISKISKKLRSSVILSIVMGASSLYALNMSVFAQTPTNLPYQSAPAPLDKVMNAPYLPVFSLSPDGQHFLLLEQQTWPDLAYLAEPELRLAGLRFNPNNFAPSRNGAYTHVTLQTIEKTTPREINGLPSNANMTNLAWSPNGKYVAFSNTQPEGIELWLIDITTAQAKRLSNVYLNKTLGSPCTWTPDSQAVICRAPAGRLKKPALQALPTGPVVMESLGKAAPGRTYQDLLKSPQDEALFNYYLDSQLWRVELNGKAQKLGAPGLITDFQSSPDGHWLLVEQLHKPFSYFFPYYRFPVRTEVWNQDSPEKRLVADLPLANEIPIARDAARLGRREIVWREDCPATLFWVEALDKGDPEQKVEFRDRLWQWSAPFHQEPQKLMDLPDRFNEIYWKNNDLALVYSYWYQKRRQEIWHLQPGKGQSKKLQTFSSEDRYANPGSPLQERTAHGHWVLMTAADGKTLFLRGNGASPEGDRPFLDTWNPFTDERQRLWRSEAPNYEQVVQVLDPVQMKVLTRRESPEKPPNYILHDFKTKKEQALTAFAHPVPELAQVHKEIIEYTRADGVKLNATLYLPAGYTKAQGPLPTVFWAYPREFKSADAAGQVQGSPYSFTRIMPSSPLVFLTQGYAVVDHPAMPIIGEGEQQPNDTYVKQLVSSAQAAVDKVVEMGVADRKRLAIGGHSYGAFMTANLLVHSDLFRAGIARSGAYNRTLTPFGFQSEERNFWQAPEVYNTMSPLMHADKITEPLLLIHGQADNNSGTFPMQSEYFYQALKGLGAPVRMVLLPYESHGYQAKESLNHMLWEMVSWLDTHVKNAK